MQCGTSRRVYGVCGADVHAAFSFSPCRSPSSSLLPPLPPPRLRHRHRARSTPWLQDTTRVGTCMQMRGSSTRRQVRVRVCVCVPVLALIMGQLRRVASVDGNGSGDRREEGGREVEGSGDGGVLVQMWGWRQSAAAGRSGTVYPPYSSA
ncbi:hypothetical protein B0H13DRAFT_2150907 [Mycena leptocephala]|nr:hypothetical protein B0H13DRAFT_2150907 [Mycena leptocephala]